MRLVWRGDIPGARERQEFHGLVGRNVGRKFGVVVDAVEPVETGHHAAADQLEWMLGGVGTHEEVPAVPAGESGC